jgi:hypothetical protein
MQQVSGRADITVNGDGVLISKDKKEGTNDLIDEAVKNNGQLPANLTPQAPVQRSTRPASSNQRPQAPVQNPGQPATAPPTSTPPPGIKP